MVKRHKKGTGRTAFMSRGILPLSLSVLFQLAILDVCWSKYPRPCPSAFLGNHARLGKHKHIRSIEHIDNENDNFNAFCSRNKLMTTNTKRIINTNQIQSSLSPRITTVHPFPINTSRLFQSKSNNSINATNSLETSKSKSKAKAKVAKTKTLRQLKKPKKRTRKPATSQSNYKSIKAAAQNDTTAILEIKLFRKPKQKRRKMRRPRRPPSYWSSITNIETEMRKFWSSLNVPIDPPPVPPAIPSEALLNHFERHDLRYAIANMGGRESVSYRMGGAKLVPGKWRDAVRHCKEVQLLLDEKNPAGAGLSRDIPPIAPHVERELRKGGLLPLLDQDETEDEETGEEKGHNLQQNGSGSGSGDNGGDSFEYNDDLWSMSVSRKNQNEITALRYHGGERWAHQSSRNPRGHWSEQRVISELYEYLEKYKDETGRPSIWMPRPSELATEGRDDLKQAIVRYGGAAKICSLAQLIPYREWRYFESQLELFVELQNYLHIFHKGDESTFPKLQDVRENGHIRLHDLIMEYGGRKLIASRLDMEFQAQTKIELFQGMTFGPFSLDFCVRLLHYIRMDMLQKEVGPGWWLNDGKCDSDEDDDYSGHENDDDDLPSITMPTTKRLLEDGEVQLVEEVRTYGGHESVARRLCLAFDKNEAEREAAERNTWKMGEVNAKFGGEYLRERGSGRSSQ